MKFGKVKNVIFIFLVFFVFSILFFTNGFAAAEPIKLTISTASLGGNMYVIGGAIGRLIEEKIPGSIITVQPGGSGSNPIIIGDEQVAIGTTMYGNATAALDGRAPYKKAETDVVALINFNIKQWITFVTTENKFNTLKEMVEDENFKIKLSVGKAGSTSETYIRWILEEYGLTYDDIRKRGGKVTHVSHADSVNLMKDGHTNLYGSIPSATFPVMVDLTTARNIKHLDLDKDIIDKIAKENKLMTGILPANSYKGQDKDLYTLMESQLLIANKNLLSEEQAYLITKVITENKERLANAHADMINFDPTIAPKNTGFPLHPGAEKYYKEVGLLE